MDRIYDVCIVGGGASGLAAAVYIKQKNSKMSVAVLERLPRVGKKLILTGNGRCNITNNDETLTHIHGNNSGFASYSMQKYSNKEIERFFASIGVPIVYDETGRGYPASFQAASVVDALRFSANALGVDVYTDCKVLDILFGNTYTVKTETGNFTAKSVVFAAGLYSGGARLGCDGYVYKLLLSKGYSAVKVSPAIVQLKTDNRWTKQLKGIKVNAAVTLTAGDVPLRTEIGEVLFCDYGLSGPPVLQVAREVERQSQEKYVLIDFLPSADIDDVIKLLSSLKNVLSYRNLDEFLSGAFNKRVGQVIIKSVGLKLDSRVADISESDLTKIAYGIKNFRISVVSTTGFENSQVTAGGLNTDYFDDKTMMSKIHKNIYAVGEILDIDGDCGGYNLHFAFSSAFCAAESIIKEYINA